MKAKTYVIWYVILFVAGMLMVCWLLSSCNTAKDNKAFKRVVSNSKLLDSVGKRWERENPCIPNSGTKGTEIIKVDTVYDLNFDYLFSSGVVTDSFIKAHPELKTYTIRHDFDSFPPPNNNDRDWGNRGGFILTDSIITYVPVKVYITKTITRVDTVRDQRREQLLSKEIAFKEGQIKQLESDKKALQAEVKKEHKRGNKFIWWLVGLGVLIGVSRFLKYRYKIKWL